LIGKWVGHEYLITIKDTTGKELNSIEKYTSSEGYTLFSLHRDTFKFNKEYIDVEDENKRTIDNYTFKILKNTDSFLWVSPISGNAKNYCGSDSILKLIRREYVIDKDINLEKIIFHSTGCFGSCPILDIEIDSNKQILYETIVFKERGNPKIDSLLTGDFKGNLRDSNYAQLNSILQNCDLKDFSYQDDEYPDGSSREIIVYYNGKKEKFRSMEIPPMLDDLIDYFYRLNKMADLKRTTEDFKIEDDRIPERLNFIPPRIHKHR